MTTPDDFKDHPETVGELRSGKSEDSADWSPRDVLIAALREIDSGKVEPTALVLVMKLKPVDQKKSRARYMVSSPDLHVTLGLLSSAAIKMHQLD